MSYPVTDNEYNPKKTKLTARDDGINVKAIHLRPIHETNGVFIETFTTSGSEGIAFLFLYYDLHIIVVQLTIYYIIMSAV